MKVACVQANVVFSNPSANAVRASAELEKLKGRGVDLVVFPEAFLTGYCVASRDQAVSIAIPRTAREIQNLQAICSQLDIIAIIGFAERDGDQVFNSAALFEPRTETRFYRKTHIPELGLDKHVGKGEELEPFDTRLGKIGILICFDQRQPEAARALALKGAELIALPTNWPVGAETSADVMCIARAAENRVFYAACNRCGEENGFRFIGRSKIISPDAKVLASASDGEEILVAEVNLAEARVKREVVRPGEYEWTVFESRRPELYDELVKEREPAAK